MKNDLVPISLETAELYKDEIQKFIDEFISGEVYLHGHWFNGQQSFALYRFQFNTDAVAFKLRWT